MTRRLLSTRGLAWAAMLVFACAGPCRAQQEPAGVAEREVQPLVLVQPINGPIGVSAVYSVQDSLREARARGFRKVVLDLDTPGGPIDATREIEALISSIATEEVQVVAFVRHHAYSAGAYIALACSEIYMAPGSSMGAITPVAVGPGGVQQIPDDDVRKKMIAALRSDIRALVERRKGARPGLAKAAEAMVDPGLQVYEVTYRDETGIEKTAIVDDADLRDFESRRLEIVNRRALGPPPLALSASEALRLGFSSGTYSSVEALVREEFLMPPESIWIRHDSWSEEAVAWLDTMKPVLFVLGFLLLLLELKTPGFAVPGVLGIVLLALAMFGSYLVGLANWTEILLFFLGIGMVGVEIFVLPGMLIFGLAGLVCIIAGLILSQQSFFLPANAAQQDILFGNLTNMLLLTLLVIACSIALWKLTPHIPVFNKILQTPPPPQPGTSTQFARRGGSAEEARARLVGRSGVALTDLRPVGAMELEGERYDAMTEGTFVARGTPVRVTAVLGNQIVVEAIEESDGRGDAQLGEVALGLLVMLWILGLCLAIAEIFFPSFGILSVLAAVSFVAAIFLAYTHHGMVTGNIFLGAAAIAVPVAAYYGLRLLPRTAIGKMFLLKGPDRAFVARAAEEPGLDRFLHKTGSALSSLRPSGTARIDGERVDVITRGEMLDKGTPLRVIEVEANRVVVARNNDQLPRESS